MLFAALLSMLPVVHPGLWLLTWGLFLALGLCALIASLSPRLKRLVGGLSAVGASALWWLPAVLHPCGDFWWIWVC